MIRASAETASPGNESGFTTRRAEHTGLRPEDPALLSKLRLDATASVETLFDRYHEKVYGLAMSILMNKREAEEAARDVFLAVVRKAECFQEGSGNHSWIYRICVNTCLMRLRKGRRAETVPIEEFLPAFTKEGAHAGPVEDWSREVERRIPEKEIGWVIGGFAGELPEKYRLVFVLCDVQGFSCEEAAQVLGLSIAVVKSRLHQVKLYLRERLGRYFRDGREENRREESAMCYNCGCGKPGDDMGDPKNITDKTFEEAAKAAKQSLKEAKKNTLDLLKITLKKE